MIRRYEEHASAMSAQTSTQLRGPVTRRVSEAARRTRDVTSFKFILAQDSSEQLFVEFRDYHDLSDVAPVGLR